MTLELYVAHNETVIPYIQPVCEKLGVSLIQTKLEIGDIMVVRHHPDMVDETDVTRHILENIPQIKDKTGKLDPIILVERKAIEDFCQSLSSLHKKEQNLRMIQFRHNTGGRIRLYFTVEGYIQLKDLDEETICGKDTYALECAFTKLKIRDRIHVEQVFNLKDHAKWLEMTLKMLIKEPELTTNVRNLELEYLTGALKIQKKGNMNRNNIFLRQLMCYDKVTPNVAQAIAEKYSCFEDLFEAWKSHSHPEKMLVDILIPSPTGKPRKLGPVRSKTIYENCHREV
jgi:hypothetical protein